MTRRVAISVLAALGCACSKQKHSLKDMLPVQVHRAWTLQETKNLEPATAPELLRNLGVEQAMEAHYAGNGAIKVRIYQMRGGASAFEAMQKWPHSEAIPIERGTFFITVQGEGVGREELIGFVQALNTDLKVPG